MKINSALPAIANSLASAPPKGAAPTAKAAGIPGGERVDISALSARLQGAGSGEMPFDAQKVAEIKQSIAAGRFQINPERIADGLLQSVRELLDARRQ